MPTKVLGVVGVKGMGSCPAGVRGISASLRGAVTFGVTTGWGGGGVTGV